MVVMTNVLMMDDGGRTCEYPFSPHTTELEHECRAKLLANVSRAGVDLELTLRRFGAVWGLSRSSSDVALHM